MDRGRTTLLKGLLWVRKVLGSLFKDTCVLDGKILESCKVISSLRS